MSFSIEAIDENRLAEYARVPLVCDVTSLFDIDEINGGSGDLGLRERAVTVPYIKDYDACRDGGPLNWPARFNISRWGLWIAREHGEVVGGTAVAWNVSDLEMLEGRDDLAVLWDIRVQATSRRQGMGTALFMQAAHWAKSKGCSLLKIETQNVNVGACRFYAKMGCVLSGIDREAYRHCPEVAHEIQLMWHLDLSRVGGRVTPA